MFNELVRTKVAFKIASASSYSRKGERRITCLCEFLFAFSLNLNAIQEWSKTSGMSYLYAIYYILSKHSLRLLFKTIWFQTDSIQNAAAVL